MTIATIFIQQNMETEEFDVWATGEAEDIFDDAESYETLSDAQSFAEEWQVEALKIGIATEIIDKEK